MLRVVAPHCIGTPGAERHAYQEEMAQVLSDVCSSVESQRRVAVVSAETHLADAEVDAEKAGVQLAGTEQEVLRVRAACEGKAASAKSAADGVVSAQQALSAEERRVEALANERACAEAEKEEYEGVLQDTLTRLKEGVKVWREREKLLKLLLNALGGLGLDRSLLDALPVALKTKAESRGVFANLAVTAAEEGLQKRISMLSEQAEGMGRESTERVEAAQRAQEALTAAQQAQSAALDEHVAAQNTLFETETSMQEAVACVKSAKAEISQRSTVLSESRVESSRVSQLFAQFTQWRDGPQDAPAASVMVVELADAAETPGIAEVTKMTDKVDMPKADASLAQAALVAGA